MKRLAAAFDVAAAAKAGTPSAHCGMPERHALTRTISQAAPLLTRTRQFIDFASPPCENPPEEAAFRDGRTQGASRIFSNSMALFHYDGRGANRASQRIGQRLI
jgi:hypothetical protein